MSRSSVRQIPFSEAEISCLVSEVYDIQVRLVLECDSYNTRTYLLEDVIPSPLPHASNSFLRRSYILKVNSVVITDPRKASVQNDVALFAREAGFPVSAPIRTKEGKLQKLMSFENLGKGTTDTHVIRLFEYLPGTMLEKIKLTKPLCRQIGHYAGWLDKIYQTYTGYDESVKEILKSPWNLSELPTLKSKLDIIKDSKRHSLVKSIISAFEEEVLKHEGSFSKGFIHGDLNECNILVSQGKYGASDSPAEPFHVIGIIDLGDIDYSCHLFEVAIAICYVMMNPSGVPVVEAAGCVLCDYLKHVKLSDFELDRLKICVCARLAASAVLGLVAQINYPNDNYKLLHLNRQWAPMEKLWAMPDKEFLEELFKERT